ncbi:unnamed protein product [Owenia fusiformis]|uniref:Uncharacterized protein n=1 Tax=Owenia fusiformis TaxID=6347 RepID=A0A8S4PDW5_OWEFU|nr:unnamed protein product [Owenia fusiformis]
MEYPRDDLNTQREETKVRFWEYKRISWISKWLFCWVSQLKINVTKGRPGLTYLNKDGDIDDETSLLKILFRKSGRKLILSGLLFLISENVLLGLPTCLKQITRYISGSASLETAIIWSCGFLLLLLCHALLHHYALFVSKHVAGIMDYTCRLHIMNKLSTRTDNEGEDLMVKMNDDLKRVSSGIKYMHFTWVYAIQLLVIAVLLFRSVSYTLIIICVIVVVSALILAVKSNLAAGRKKITKAREEHEEVGKGIFGNMEFLSRSTWQKPLLRRYKRLKRIYLGLVQTNTIVRLCLRIAAFVMPHIGFSLVLAVYLGQNTPPTYTLIPDIVIWLILFQYGCTRRLPDGVYSSIRMVASVNRIQKFLVKAEDVRNPMHNGEDTGMYDVILENVSGSWQNKTTKKNVEDAVFLLQDINIEIRKGEMVYFVGPPASGKSTLMAAIMGQLPFTKGRVFCTNSISYAPQDNYMLPGTIRDNILLGKDFDPERYEAVIEACVLGDQLGAMQREDFTEIYADQSEVANDVVVKVNIARVLYADTDMYVFEDIFSYLDEPESVAIFKRGVQSFLHGKTRIMISRTPPTIPTEEARICSFIEGTLFINGLYQDIDGQDRVNLINNVFRQNDTKLSDITKEAISSENKYIQYAHKNILANAHPENKTLRFGKLSSDAPASVSDLNNFGYWSELLTCRLIALMCMFITSVTVCQACLYVGIWWIITLYETSSEDLPLVITAKVEKDLLDKQWNAIYIYIGMTGGSVVCGLISALVLPYIMRHVSQRVYLSTFNILLRTNGNSRVTLHQGETWRHCSVLSTVMDEKLPQALFSFTMAINTTIGALVLITISQPWALIALLATAVVISLLAVKSVHFLRLCRITDFWNNTNYINFWTQSQATGPCTNSVKSYVVDKLKRMILAEINGNISLLGSLKWLFLRIQFIELIAIIAILIIVLLHPGTNVAGPSLVLTFMIAAYLNAHEMVKYGSELGNMISLLNDTIERLDLNKVLQPPTYIPVSKSWPVRTTLNVEYRNQVLQEPLKCIFREGDMVSVYGQNFTDTAIFTELFCGKNDSASTVTIDGVNIATVNPKNLSEVIAIIPKEIPIFKATLRTNLDPLHEYADSELWLALQETGLKPMVDEFKHKLYTLVDGDSFDVLEKQLLLLTCALLREQKIIVICDGPLLNRYSPLLESIVERSFPRCIFFFVTKSASPLDMCDKILVLHDGHPIDILRTNDLNSQRENVDGAIINHVERGKKPSHVNTITHKNPHNRLEMKHLKSIAYDYKSRQVRFNQKTHKSSSRGESSEDQGIYSAELQGSDNTSSVYSSKHRDKPWIELHIPDGYNGIHNLSEPESVYISDQSNISQVHTSVNISQKQSMTPSVTDIKDDRRVYNIEDQSVATSVAIDRKGRISSKARQSILEMLPRGNITTSNDDLSTDEQNESNTEIDGIQGAPNFALEDAELSDDSSTGSFVIEFGDYTDDQQKKLSEILGEDIQYIMYSKKNSKSRSSDRNTSQTSTGLDTLHKSGALGTRFSTSRNVSFGTSRQSLFRSQSSNDRASSTGLSTFAPSVLSNSSQNELPVRHYRKRHHTTRGRSHRLSSSFQYQRSHSVRRDYRN